VFELELLVYVSFYFTYNNITHEKNITIYCIKYFLIIAISATYSAARTYYKKRLDTTHTQLNGLSYLDKLSKLSIAITRYLDNNTYLDNKLKIKFSVQDLQKEQKRINYIASEELNTQLEHMKEFKISEDDYYYKFLDTLNHENYIIGDKFKLLYEEDRKLFLLNSLATHYTPEYLISLLITHQIMQEFQREDNISDKKKNIFIEQLKLTSLSQKEIRGILDLLHPDDDVKILKNMILEIEKECQILKKAVPVFDGAGVSRMEFEKYLISAKKLLKLSFKFNNKQNNLIKDTLNKRESKLKIKIYQINMIFILIIIIFVFLVYLFYKSYLSNILKDKELEKINKRLDELVVFSKTNIEGDITYVSAAFEKVSGYSKKELIGQNHRILRHNNMKEEFYTNLWDTILDKKVFIGKMINKAKNGSEYWVKATITPELDASGNIISFNAYGLNITDQKALEEKRNELLLANKKLEELSVMDPLTQIYNRLKLDSVMQDNYNTYQRYSKIFSIILIDIDHFKDVNDTYGHLVGDDTLCGIVNIIKNITRDTDTFGRWGGEEFMIISQETACDGAYILAEKIRKAIESYEFDIIGKKTVSLGVSQIDQSISVLELTKRADDALYTAKDNGRNKTLQYKNI